ncbi:MAG: HAD family hydrolase [bacterium]
MVRRIIFDLDDTLIQTGQYYNRQLELFTEKILDNFSRPEDSEEVLTNYFEIDSKAIMKHGYDKAHFPEAMAKTWEYYCRQEDKPLREDDLQECQEIGWEVYSTVPEPVEGMEEILNRLRLDYELILYTMGDSEIQFEKIRHHNLEQWFKEMHVVPLKERQYLAQIVNPYPRGETMIVGDSLRGEIKPALELGIKAIHRQSDFPWGFHEVEVEGDYPQIRELLELFEFLP